MDKAKAQQIIDETVEKIKALEAEMEQLTGKDNKKARNAKSREAADLKKTDDYTDAERVLAGKDPVSAKWKGAPPKEEPKEEPKAATPKAAGGYVAPTASLGAGKKKDEKKPGKEEAGGISPAERDELEKLKKDIVAKKTELKAQGLSGGQQNKDPDVVKMVGRMNELKAKAGELETKEDKKAAAKKGKAGKGNPEEINKLKAEIEEYKHKLKTEFGYTNKDIAKDDDILEMQKRLKAMDV